MTDLETRLRALHLPETPVTDDVVRADVRRARAAAARRRTVRLATGGAGLLAVGTVAAAVVVSGQPQSPTRSEVASPTPNPAVTTSPGTTGAARPDPSAESGIRLVDYAGEQENGFEVAKVPDGYVLQGATPYSLDIAPAEDRTGLDVFVGKLVVMLQSQDAPFHRTGQAVTVHGSPGFLRTQDDARILEYDDGEHIVVVQAWQNIGLTDAQLVEFADGVTVTSAAEAGVG